MITHRKTQQSFRKQENSPYVKKHDWFSPPYSVSCRPSERVLTPRSWLVISFSKNGWPIPTEADFLEKKNPNESRPIGSKVKIWPKFIQNCIINDFAHKFNSQRTLVQFQSFFGLDLYIKGLKKNLTVNVTYKARGLCSKSSTWSKH